MRWVGPVFNSLDFRAITSRQQYLWHMGVLVFIIGLFILMGGVQMLGVAAIGAAIIGAFVFSSMAVGKLLFRL